MVKQTNKSEKRTRFMEKIMSALKHGDIYNTINYERQSEDKIKTFIYPHIIRELKKSLMRRMDEEKADKQARQMLLWEGNKQTVVNNVMFLGTQHRPDMVVEGKTMKIAIEIKKGKNGASIREGIGQSMVYSMVYDFVIYLFIDTSKDKKILNSLGSNQVKTFIHKLWQENNILFGVV